MLVYTLQINNRVEYIFRTIFEDIWNSSIEFTTNSEYFQQHTGPKLNYSIRRFNDEIFIESHGLLQEKGILDQDIQIIQWDNLPAFFATSKNSSVPFDLFAASFYLLSRYEEYLPHIRDNYERFMAKESLAFKHGFLQKPLINMWLVKFLDLIKLKYSDYIIPKQSFKYVSTIDIDNAYCYLEKGFLRTIGAFARSIWRGDWEEMEDRWQVLTKKKNDPYDTFDIQLSLQEKYNLEVIYFVLLADYGLNDKNIPVNSRKFQLLIKHLSDHALIGIHPSFGSNFKKEKLGIERKRLQDIVKREVHSSRHHFLKLSFPKTYRKLLDLDIKNDYTMGYAALPGFRASICAPFYFYDLEKETSTKLKIHPFMVMDATFKYYLEFNPKQSFDLIVEMIDEVKKVNGTFISLWHNEAWSNYRTWKGWMNLYEDIVEYVKR